MKTGRPLRSSSEGPAGPGPAAFTLLELLIAVAAFAIVLAAINSVFYSALRLRNHSDQLFTDDLALHHTLTLLRRDIANLLPPGGTLTGNLQTTPSVNNSGTGSGTGSGAGGGLNASAGSMALVAAASRPGQGSPEFYTTTGSIDETSPWSEIQRVAYILTPSTNNTAGRNLFRVVSRNLLPSLQDQSVQTPLLSGVDSIYFQYHDGSQWQDTWDSTSETTARLPTAVRVQISMTPPERGRLAPPPVELIVPVVTYGGTNATQSTSTTGGGQ